MQHIAGNAKGKRGDAPKISGQHCNLQVKPRPLYQLWPNWRFCMSIKDVEILILKTAQQDRTAFEALYRATSAKLLGVALRILGNRAEAEDALQEIYIKIWSNADRYEANGLSPMTWLITIARNTAIDRLRARRAGGAELEEIADLADHAPGPEAAAVAASQRAQIAACLATLEPDKAQAVRQAYLFGATYLELAGQFDVPLNTIRTWLRRSLLKLRACLSHDG